VLIRGGIIPVRNARNNDPRLIEPLARAARLVPRLMAGLSLTAAIFKIGNEREAKPKKGTDAAQRLRALKPRCRHSLRADAIPVDASRTVALYWRRVADVCLRRRAACDARDKCGSKQQG
jgi:hypothetical protein